MSDSIVPHTCRACWAIDRADGVEDGKLFRSVGPRVKNERWILRCLLDAQDLLADKITAFAGSMSFVYIHAVGSPSGSPCSRTS